MEKIELYPIGVIHSPFGPKNLPPDQGIETDEVSEIEIFPEYRNGLSGLERCNKMLVLYWMGNGTDRNTLWNERKNRGCFVTRTPNRPNPVAVSLVDIVSFSSHKIVVKYLEGFNGSLVLDIKPHARKLDGSYKKSVPTSNGLFSWRKLFEKSLL